MADKAVDEHRADLDQELDAYIDSNETSRVQELLAEQVRRSPWWAISFLVHAIALLIMWRWPYAYVHGDEQVLSCPVVTLAEERFDEQMDDYVPAENLVPEDPPDDVPIKDIPLTQEPVSEEELGFELDLKLDDDVMHKDVERPLPSIDPPANTPVIAITEDRAGTTRGIYTNRTKRGRASKVGKPWGTTRITEATVEAGLRWLVRAQSRDGRWDCKRWGGGGDYDVGMTGLSLLAFLGAGFTQKSGRYKTTVAKGLAWLAANQKPNGQFPYKTFYEQGIAALAVSEAYGLTRSHKVGRMAHKAIRFIVKLQPDHGGFRYGGAVPRNEGDLSVTGWQIMAIKSGVCSGLDVPDQAIERCRAYLKNSYRQYGKSCYTVGGGAGSPAMWAVGMACRQFIGGDYDDEIRAAANALLNHEKAGGAAKGRGKLIHDLYYTYYAVLGMYQMGPHTEYWLQWNRLFRDPLAKAQIHERFDRKGQYVRGSWDPANHQWGSRGGRVYTTAMAILSLEVYYRFPPLYRATK